MCYLSWCAACSDFFFDEVNTRNGGNRVATVLVFLNDVAEGGETVSCTPASMAAATARFAATAAVCAA
jgi:hypothetical protein